jgi:hypothetical protein
VCGLLLAGAWPQAASALPPRPERVSVSSAGGQSDSYSEHPSISADGRYVAFDSAATNLVPGDTNGATDVFVRDRRLGTTVRPVTSAAGGVSDPAISADGRFLAVTSAAPDLVPGDTNGVADVFLLDLAAGTVERISVTSTGEQAAGGGSGDAAISADNRFVSFTSAAPNLLPGPDANGGPQPDTFVRDRELGTTALASVGLTGLNADAGSESRGISADGRYAAFISLASDLIPDDAITYGLYVRDLLTDVTTRESLSSTGAPISGLNSGRDGGTISADGRFVVFETGSDDVVPGDTNHAIDTFLRDRVTGAVERLSVDENGAEVFGDSYAAMVGAGGRCVIFTSYADNLVHDDTDENADVFLRDRVAGTITRLTVDHRDRYDDADHDSGRAVITPDGRVTAYSSFASNLVPRDTNNSDDIFAGRTGCA